MSFLKKCTTLLGGSLLGLSSAEAQPEPPIPLSDHYNGKFFFNHEGGFNKTFWDVLKWKWQNGGRPWPQIIPVTEKEFQHHNSENAATATFVTHATVVLEINGKRFVTDPVFSARIGPWEWVGLKRTAAPGIPLEKIPFIDVVLVSHNHYDHMDIPSLKRLSIRDNPLFIVPLGNGGTLRGAGISRIVELDWWQSHSIEKNISVTLTPAAHWSGRWMTDRNKALWGGFFVQGSGKSFYYSGDTGYSKVFSEIPQKLGAPSLALLPIGAYEPRWFMKEHHLSPADAAQAHLDLKAELSMAIHHSTFQLSDEGPHEPAQELQRALKEKNILSQSFRVIEFGERIEF